MRLIDADVMFDFIQQEKAWKQGTMQRPRYDKGKYDAFYETLEIIKNQPTVNAVPVVRCGECEYWQNDGVHIYGMCENPNIGNVKLDTDFCSYGERKDDTHE